MLLVINRSVKNKHARSYAFMKMRIMTHMFDHKENSCCKYRHIRISNHTNVAMYNHVNALNLLRTLSVFEKCVIFSLLVATYYCT